MNSRSTYRNKETNNRNAWQVFAPIIFAGLIALSLQAVAQDRTGPILQSVFQQDRSTTEDVVYFRNNDILRGEVLNETITINTPYGMVEIPLRACAGISFEGAQTNTESLVTTNFNRFTGIITDRIIRLRIGTSGAEIEIRKEQIRFILLKQEANEGQLTNPEQTTDLFLMANGDLLTGTTKESRFVIGTTYADVPVNFDELKQVEMQGDANVTTVATKLNGDVMRGALVTDDLTLNLNIGVQVPAVYKDKFAKIFVGDGNVQAATQFGVRQPIRGESDGAQFPATAVAPDGALRQTAQTAGEAITNSIGMQLVLIQPGTFNNEVSEVTISKPFYMGIYPVTQEQWYVVMGTNPSRFTGPNRPVEQVSWDDAQSFLKKLSEKDGAKYRLPTEAEWEYACRAGTKTAYYWGDEWDDDYGWCHVNSSERTQDVGMKKPNPWGLYDMSGNVWEWCQDWYDRYPPLSSVTDPKGPASGERRVLRGGSWGNFPENCRSAHRSRSAPAGRGPDGGFRVVRTP